MLYYHEKKQMSQIPFFGYIDPVEIGFSISDFNRSESSKCAEVLIEIKSHPEGAPRSFNVSLSTQTISAGMYNYTC